ncbi:hypothetical protein B0T21DRAFT_280129 [Apiosordaria backusii]|uniref:Uncharacterized protein n=1 Tax=Apiosordaria backusii TaxID=314023 RepID=A0AA40K395_9PEZI|nr:hypothetical protein B0T21DRAFT_280129 [Apiosordaria backusii]
MAPPNGVADKPATRRAASQVVPIVPVLPLSYLQRPLKKPVPASPPAITGAPSPSAQKVIHDKPSSPTKHDRQDALAHQPASLEQKVCSDRDAATPSAAPVHIATHPEGSTSSTTASDGQTPDSSTICSEPTDYHLVSIAPPHPASHHNPAFNQPAMTNSAPELPLPAPHPVIENRPGFHQTRPSDGSLVFAHHESNTSSPAPHLGNYGFFPPGIVPFQQLAAHPVTAVDPYGRPLLVSPTVDNFPPTAIKHHGPPTPHSYHASQSSQIEDHVYSQHPTMNGAQPAMNGTQPPANGTQPPANGPQLTANGSNNYRPTEGMSNEAAAVVAHDMGGIFNYIRSGLRGGMFNDCSLDIHCSISRVFQDNPDYGRLNPAIQGPAHRFILARSPRLAEYMRSEKVHAGGVVEMEVRDEWIRPDVFWHCIRALYGWTIATGYLPSQLIYWNIKDEFKTALSYYAAGQFLHLPPIQAIASDRANRLLGWETISLAVWFVSQNMALGAGMTHDILLDNTLNWVMYHLPQTFDVDEEAGDCGFSRLPPTKKSASYKPNPTAPRVSSRVAANPRLSQIKFGDLSAETFDVTQLFPGSPYTPVQVNGLFSRILLNLPFDLLKHVLEHPNLCANARPLLPGPRLRIIETVCAAREKRRWEYLESTDVSVRTRQERLAAQPKPVPVSTVEDYWHNNLGYKEDVVIGDAPILVRSWSLGPERGTA